MTQKYILFLNSNTIFAKKIKSFPQCTSESTKMMLFFRKKGILFGEYCFETYDLEMVSCEKTNNYILIWFFISFIN